MATPDALEPAGRRGSLRTVTARYSLELEDVVALLDASPEPRGAKDRAPGIVVSLGAVAIVFVIAHDALRTTAALAVTLLAAALLLPLPFRRPKGTERMARALIRKHPRLFTGECEDTIAPTGVTTRSAGGTTSLPWSDFSRFDETPTHFVLYDHDSGPAVLIPRRALLHPAECAALLATCLPHGRRGTMHVIIDDAPSPY